MIDRVVGDKGFFSLGIRQISGQFTGIQHETVAECIDVAKQQILEPIVGIVEISRLGPRRKRDSGQLHPMDERPLDAIFEMQEEDDGVGIDLADSAPIANELERKHLEREADRYAILGL